MIGTTDTESAVGDKTAVRPFQVSFPQLDLTELRRRVDAARWPERETVSDDSQGVPLPALRRWVSRRLPSCLGFTPTCLVQRQLIS
jgi:hypothetical protein